MTELLSKMLTVKIESFGAIQRHLPENLIERCACAMGEGMINRQTVISHDAVIVLLSPVAGG